MDKTYELKYHRLEENNWWFVARRNIILKLIKQYALNPNDKILEIGCSGGPLIKLLKQNKFTNVYGIDISEDAVNICRKKGIENIEVMDGVKTKFGGEEFDIVVASDVLEHIEDDVAALAEWKRILKPGGKLIIFAPAFNFLWSSHDEANHHRRRYKKSSIALNLKKVDFKINKISYWNFSLFFPVGMMRVFQRFLKKQGNSKEDQLYELNILWNKFFFALLSIENWLLNFFNFPIGVSIFSVCEKRDDKFYRV